MREMKLQELKAKTPAELVSFAEELEVENASTMRKQELMLSRATSISTLPVEAGSRWLSKPRWHSDPQAARCRTRAQKRVPRLPRRSAVPCSPINGVSRLRLPGQSGSSPRTTPSVWRRSVP